MRAAHSYVLNSILSTLSGHTTTNAAGHADTPSIQLDLRVAEHEARFLPAGHDTANSKLSVEIPHHEHDSLLHSAPAIFELGCHVCGLQEAWARGVMNEKNGTSCLVSL